MSIFFKDRDGNTVLSNEERKGLKSQGIQTMGDLDAQEQLNINQAMLWLRSQNLKNLLSIEFSKRLHKRMFGSTWDWAGDFRKSDKNIGPSWFQIPNDLANLFEDTKVWIEHESYSPAEIVARFHHRLIWIHPFPNGNGRFTRLMTQLLCKKYDFSTPNFHPELDPKERRDTYLEALRAADERDYLKLISFLN